MEVGAVTAPAPGTQPEGIRDQREASAYVRRMFTQIAPRYDLLNHLLSLNLDRRWRRRAAQGFAHVVGRPGARVLDLCCGTGDLTFALQRRAVPGVTFVGSDFAHPMLTRAREKAAVPGSAQASHFAEADALQLPFAAETFDLVVAAFGFRNLANYQAGLQEMHRVLKPGGEAGILEFSAARNSLVTALYQFYFTKVLPRIGGALSGNPAAYSYLPASVLKFPSPQELMAQMAAAGFHEARYETLTLGAVALHQGKKL